MNRGSGGKIDAARALLGMGKIGMLTGVTRVERRRLKMVLPAPKAAEARAMIPRHGSGHDGRIAKSQAKPRGRRMMH